MVTTMKRPCAILISVVTLAMAAAHLGTASAQEPTTEAPKAPAKGPRKPPTVEEAIPQRITKLKPPQLMEFPGGIVMAVSTSSEAAQKHVLNGLNHLHGGWEFEASRHFATAMKEDPDCLLAHWGMTMAVLDSPPENAGTRKAVVERMIALLEAGQGTELERAYVYGLLKYLTEGANGATESFLKISRRYPNEMQAAIFSALFSRGGYDFTGKATPNQLESERQLLALIEKHPKSPVPLNALLTVRAEAPELQDSLPLARKLTRLWPSYPPAFHLLGHYEWRSGNHARAAAAFGRASTLYQKWMKQNGLTISDCPEWPKSESYRVVALLSMGDYETAHAAATQVASIPLPADRLASPGARNLLWDAKTLPARILIHRGLEDSFVEASKALPTVAEVKPTMKTSSAYLWIDGLRLALAAQQLVDKGDIDKARAVVASMSIHLEKFEDSERTAAALGERSQWLRAHRSLKVLQNDVRGRIASNGPEDLRGTAFNWYTSAADHQQHERLLYAPMLLTPMSARLGDFFLQEKEPDKAIKHYEEALKLIPADIHSLMGLRKACIASGDNDRATKLDLQIQKLKNP